MSKYEEIDQLLKAAGAFIAGGQSEVLISAAEAKLGVIFPPSFRCYLQRWGNLSFGSYEYYGLTRNSDFDNASVPNCVWFTLRKRTDARLPYSLVVIRNDDDDEYICIDTKEALNNGECPMVIWDNISRSVSQKLAINFIDFLHEELLEFVEES